MPTHRGLRFLSVPSLSLALLGACGGNPPPETVGSQTHVQHAVEPGEAESGRSCGGFTLPGTPGCTEAEFCDFEVEAHCGAADQAGVCRPRPEVCTEEYAPVCGCDGQTYGNRCEAARAGTGVTALEPCAEATPGD